MPEQTYTGRALTVAGPAELGRTVLVLGNDAPVEVQYPDPAKPDTVRVKVSPRHNGYKRRDTVVVFPEGYGLVDAFLDVTRPGGMWESHSDKPPAWVASNQPALASLLGDQYGAEVRTLDLADLDEPAKLGSRKGGKPSVLGLLFLLTMLLLRAGLHLRTNAGTDWQAQQMGGTPSTTPAIYIALTANSTAPSAASTTLTGEITTAGGGLIRAAGTYAHTTGVASYTVTKTFTANGSDVLPVTLAKAGVFAHASSAPLVFETLLSATATLAAVGDNVAVTQTVSL